MLCSHDADAGRGCATKLLWTRVQGGVVEAMQHTTLAELIAFSSREPATLETIMAELQIRNLHVPADDKQILKGLDLTFAAARSTR